MDGLCIDVSPDASFSPEGEFGNISFNGLDTTVAPQPKSALSFPLQRLSVLGQGSSSIVYKSVMLNKLSISAEKVFLVGDSKKQLQLFRELQSLKSVCSTLSEKDGQEKSASPYIVELLDVFSNPADGTLSLCLEYMECGSLEHIVQLGGCREERVLSSIAFQMTSGLSFLHERRMIHRDVKPSNALISSAGCIKLADFGLARTLDSGQSLANSFVGTLLYMAPERLTGEPYSFQSDIWSLGLTLHAVALGQFPYVGKKGYWEVLHASQQGAPPLDARYSPLLRQLLLAAYQTSPVDRPSAATLLQEPFLMHAAPVVPTELRHLVCHLLTENDMLSTPQQPPPPVFVIPTLKTPAPHNHNLPQSAPSSVTGNLTFRGGLQESKSAKKRSTTSTSRQQQQQPQLQASSAVSGASRTVLLQQQRATGRQVTVASVQGKTGQASRLATRNNAGEGSSSRVAGSIAAPAPAFMATNRLSTAPMTKPPSTQSKNVATNASAPTQVRGKLTHSASAASPAVLGAQSRQVVGDRRDVTSTVAAPLASRTSGKIRSTSAVPNKSDREPAIAMINNDVEVLKVNPHVSKAKETDEIISERDLVHVWEAYVIAARARQLQEDPAESERGDRDPGERGNQDDVRTESSNTPPTAHIYNEKGSEKEKAKMKTNVKEKESYDYVASPSVAVSSLRRLIAKQHDRREVFVTEQIVQRLAATVPCDATILRAEFCAAMERINRIWQGSAVRQIIPTQVPADSTPTSSSTSSSSSRPAVAAIRVVPVSKLVAAPFVAAVEQTCRGRTSAQAESDECKGEGLVVEIGGAEVGVEVVDPLEVEDLCELGLGVELTGEDDVGPDLASFLDESIEEDAELELLRSHLQSQDGESSAATKSNRSSIRRKLEEKQPQPQRSALSNSAPPAQHEEEVEEDYADESFEVEE